MKEPFAPDRFSAFFNTFAPPSRSGPGAREITLLREDQAAISPGKEALPLGGINIRIFPCAAKA